MRNSESDPALPGFERSLAVVIGINAYSHGIPPLHNAVRDANAVADFLERQGFEVLRLLDSQATLSSLSSLLSHHLSSLSSPPDRLLLYFAGHGLAHTDEQHQLSGFLLPSDARRDDTSSYWPMASLREALSHLPCRHLLLILDCCFAGAFPHPSSRDIRAPSLPAPLYLERFRHFSSRRSFQLLLSTAHDELASDRLLAKPAQESLGDGLHSPFALALLQGLEPSSPADTNQDGLLTAAELYTFLRDRLLSLVPSHCQQTPSLWHLDWHDGGEFLFLLSDAFPALPPAAPLSQHSNPYLGLRPFSSAQRHLFFGRERLADSLLERLRSQPLLLLCGPSGAGKSSLVHAGLLPRLSEDPSWRIPPSLRPSSQPFLALSSWLSSLVPDSSAPSASTLASRPRSAADFLGTYLSRHPERSVLLVIDPLEELVTACLNDSLRKAFLRVLSGLLQLSHPRFRLLLLLRSDFEPHFLSLFQPASFPSASWHGGRIHLPPMNRDELRRCIEKPAEACVLFFSPGLVERLLDDVEQMPGALPLLSVALSELFGAYLASGRDDRILSFEDYHHIGGGIAGALQRRAELVFSGMPPPSTEGQPALPPVPPSELPAFQRTLRNVLLRMVSPEGGELARRRVPRSELEYPHRKENARVQRALRTLEASRLVVASDDAGPCVEPAHDALLSAWPRLHDWARHAQRELLLLRRISHAAFEWHRHHRASDFLWADARLDQLGVALTSPSGGDEPLALPTVSPGSQPTEPLALNAAESGFLHASAKRRRLLRTRRGVLALTLAMMLVALTVAALFQADKANLNAREAQLQQRAAETSAQEARKQKEVAEANFLEVQKQQRLAGLNASEAQRQQEAAEANAREARKQKEAADANAREAQLQQKVAEANLQEAQRQQQLANANAKEALTQKNTSESNAREAQRQQQVAETNAREARRQQQLANANAKETLTQRNTSEANAAEARRQQEAAEANALEARKQQESADTNFREARKQQETAEANAREAQWQQKASEIHLQEARRLQQIADINANEALAQRNIAESNALEARKQKEAAVANERKAQEQAELVMASVRATQVDRLVKEDPTKAMLVLIEATQQFESPDSPWYQTVLDISHHAISSAILLHSDNVYEARFSPDGSHVLTASADGTARIWRTDGKGGPVILTGHDDAVFSATFSPDGSHVLTASADGTARIWRTNGKGKPYVLIDDDYGMSSATFSPDGSLVLTVSHDGTARVWRTDRKGEPVILKGHRESVTSATFSPDGSLVLTASADRTVRIWRTEDAEELFILEGHTEEVTSATFSPDGSRILTASDDGTARIWRTEDAEELFILKGHTEEVTSATFSPDGSLVLTSSHDGTARVWRTEGAGDPLILKGHSAAVNSATFSPDGSRILTASDDGTARIWRIDGKGEPVILKGHNAAVTSATFSPDGSLVLTSSDDGTARIWRTDGTGEPLILVGHDESEAVYSAIFSPDGARVLTASGDGTARIWRTDGTGEPVILAGHRESVNSATFSPDGSLVLTGSADGTARIWRTDGAGEPLILVGHDESEAVFSATFSPDGARVLTASGDGTVRIWPVDGTKELFILAGHADSVTSATFSPDDSHVFTDSGDDTARIWHVDEDEQIRSLILRKSGHGAFLLPDGSSVLTLSEDGRVYIWPIEPVPLLASFSKATTACLSTNERVNYLFEALEDARKGHERCEQSHGRIP